MCTAHINQFKTLERHLLHHFLVCECLFEVVAKPPVQLKHAVLVFALQMSVLGLVQGVCLGFGPSSTREEGGFHTHLTHNVGLCTMTHFMKYDV